VWTSTKPLHKYPRSLHNTAPEDPYPHTTAARPHLRQRRTSTWGRRKHNQGIEWHSKWDKDSWKDGRVLLIDYVAREHTPSGRRKIVAQEFSSIEGLRGFYANQDLSQQAALRVIHVQNASWATMFLLRKFNIDASNDLVGTTFGRWAKYERPQRRGGKPVLNGKTFRAQRDPWRGISRTAFGLDYLRHYDRHRFEDRNVHSRMKMMELNSYDAADNPAYCYDVFVQRLSVYVQRKVDEPYFPEDADIKSPYLPEDADIKNPYDGTDIKNPYDEEAFEQYQRVRKQHATGKGEHSRRNKYVPKLSTLDNGT
jgi:hypothetical protein